MSNRKNILISLFAGVGLLFTITSLYVYRFSYNEGPGRRSLSVSLGHLEAEPATLYLCPATVEGAPSSLSCGMTIHLAGRLGNLMGLYAVLLGLSEINRRPAVVLPEMAKTLSLYFHITLPTVSTAEWTFWESRSKAVWLQDWMTPGYRNLTAPFTVLQGYPNSWTFYHHVRTRVLREFRFRDHILSHTHGLLHEIRRGRNASSVTFVGVHNRRSDYVGLMAGYYHGAVADAGFFREAFDLFEAKYPDAVFLVVSDDMNWCRKNMDASRGNVLFVGGSREPVYDLALMANCNHSVITVGTFGFWGAYLAGGDTVHLSDFLHRDSKFLKVFKYDTFFLPEWTPIAANLSASGKHGTLTFIYIDRCGGAMVRSKMASKSEMAILCTEG